MTICEELEETAFGIESRARKHQCMGADCATCNPNGVGSQLRGLASKVRDLEVALEGDSETKLSQDTPRRFSFVADSPWCGRPAGTTCYGVYFPATDLCIYATAGRGTGMPSGVTWIDSIDDIPWAKESAACLAAQVRKRLGKDGDLSIHGTLTNAGRMAYSVMWRRDYDGHGLSDHRSEHADSIAAALAKVLRWEDDADAADKMASGTRMAYAPQAGGGQEGE